MWPRRRPKRHQRVVWKEKNEKPVMRGKQKRRFRQGYCDTIRHFLQDTSSMQLIQRKPRSIESKPFDIIFSHLFPNAMKKILATVAGLSFCAVFTYFITSNFNTQHPAVTPIISGTTFVAQPTPKKVVSTNRTNYQNTQSVAPLPRPSTRTRTS